MPDRHDSWIAGGKIFEHFRFEAFTWWELALVGIVVGALAGYLLFVMMIDCRQKAKIRRKRAAAQVETWLRDWELNSAQIKVLHKLAGQPGVVNLHHLLMDPSRFERAIHRGFDEGLELDFTDRIRGFLDYRSLNPRIAVVSTRQLVVGDFLRFSVWDMAMPTHHFGRVMSSKPPGLIVQLTDEGWTMVRSRAAEAEMYFLRDNDFEYPFPLQLAPHVPGENQVLLLHQVLPPGHRPRATRLPLMRKTLFLAYTSLPVEEHAWREDTGGHQEQPPRKIGGSLVELSEGGFSAALDKPVSEGGYLQFELPLPRGRSLKIMGRVRNCRPFGGTAWLTRCELRGFSPARRGALGQLLRLAWKRRLHLLSPKPKRGKGSGRAS